MPVRLKTFFVYFIIWLSAGAIGTYFRLYPLLFHVGSDSSEKATLYVINRLRATVAAQVEQQFSHLPPYQKNQLIKKQLNQLIHEEKEKFKDTVDKVSRNMAQATRLEPKYPYLLEADPFLYYGLTQHIVETGSLSDTIKGSKYYNPYMMAPEGHWEPLNMHPYIGHAIYRSLRWLVPDFPLMYAVSFTPLVITLLALIAFFIVCAVLRLSPLASFVGAVFFLLSPIYIKRSAFGWYDNDPYNTLFPLLILAVLFYGFKNLRSQTQPEMKPLSRSKERIAPVDTTGVGPLFSPLAKIYLSTRWPGLLALVTALYALFWHGWGFFFVVICASLFCILLGSLFQSPKKRQTKEWVVFLLTYMLGTLLMIGLLFGFREFFILFREGWMALKDFLNPELSFWPDLYMSVGELRGAPVVEIIHSTGGWIFFVIALGGLLGSLINCFSRSHPTDPKIFFILLMLLASTLYITRGALRFGLLCLTPLSVFFAIGVEGLQSGLGKRGESKKTKKKERHRETQALSKIPSQKWRGGGIYLLLLGLTVFPISNAAINTLSFLNPIYNATWDRIMTHLREKTPAECIINSWWPPGHFITSMARRRVTIDGATIKYPQGYWMANFFIETDEAQAVGLIRMLNNSANQTVDYLVSQGMNLPLAVSFTKDVIKRPREHARVVLKRLLNPDQAEHVLTLTHKDPPPSFILLFNEMVEKNIQFKFIGGWDFRKIEALNQNPMALASLPPKNSKEYIDFLWSVAGDPYKYSEPLTELSRTDKEVMFEHNLIVNLKTMQCLINSDKYGKGIPRSIHFLKDGQYQQKSFDNASLAYAVVLTEEANHFQAVLMDERLAQSMLMRMFYFRGAGLKYFKLFAEEADLTGRTRIMVFEVDWQAFQTDLKKEVEKYDTETLI